MIKNPLLCEPNDTTPNTRATHLNTSPLPSSQNFIDRGLGDETQVAAAGLDASCFGLEFFARQVEIDLLGAEFQSVSKAGKEC